MFAAFLFPPFQRERLLVHSFLLLEGLFKATLLSTMVQVDSFAELTQNECPLLGTSSHYADRCGTEFFVNFLLHAYFSDFLFEFVSTKYHSSGWLLLIHSIFNLGDIPAVIIAFISGLFSVIFIYFFSIIVLVVCHRGSYHHAFISHFFTLFLTASYPKSTQKHFIIK